MLKEHEFETLKVQVSITPEAANWPKPDYSGASISGDKPTLGNADGPLHWHYLHDAVSTARSQVLRAVGSMAGVDADKALSLSGKAEKKREIATKALAALEKSQHLEKARKAVESQVERWDTALGLKPNLPDASTAMLHAEIRSHLAAMRSTDRLAFIDAHAIEVSAAVLSAPAFLSGLSAAELAIVKQRFEARTNPELAAAKAETLAALADAERGMRNASKTIRERGGLEKPHDGVEKVAQRAGTSMSV